MQREIERLQQRCQRSEVRQIALFHRWLKTWKPFARKHPVRPRVLDTNECISRALNLLRRLVGEEVSLTFKPGASQWRVKLDPAQLDQILTNLATNARDAIQGVGAITVETSNFVVDSSELLTRRSLPSGEYALIVFSDNGSGMDAETASKIF